MKLLLAGPASILKDAYTPLLRTGHKIVATATTLNALRAQALQEQQIDGILIAGEFEDAASVAQTLRELGRPTALLLPPTWDAAAFAGLPNLALLEPGVSWPVAAGALESLVQRLIPTGVAPPAVPGAAVPGRVVSPPTRPEARSLALTSSTLVLHPALGGVGASTLALTLAAAGATAGLNSLAVTADVFPLAARLSFPPTERNLVRQVGPHFSAVVVEGEWSLPPGFDLVAWDMWRGSEDLVRRWPVLIVTRPTGDGKLAAVQAAHELRQLHSTVAGICLVGRGTLTQAEFEQTCREYRVDAPVWSLPDDPAVYALNETQGHALESPLYGPAVIRLARQLWSALPWPAPAGCLTAAHAVPAAVATAAGAPRPARRKLIEIVD